MKTVRKVSVEGVDWPVQGAQVAVIRDSRILIQLRPWLPGWELPGGHCEPDEDPSLTAAREAYEETGYRVAIQALVGVYTWAGLRSAGDVLYLGRIEGGSQRRSIEAWALRFVDVEHLPRTLFPWYHQRVVDAMACAGGASPVHRVQMVTMHHVASFGTAWMRVPVDRWQRRRAG